MAMSTKGQQYWHTQSAMDGVTFGPIRYSGGQLAAQQAGCRRVGGHERVDGLSGVAGAGGRSW